MQPGFWETTGNKYQALRHSKHAVKLVPDLCLNNGIKKLKQSKPYYWPPGYQEKMSGYDTRDRVKFNASRGVTSGFILII